MFSWVAEPFEWGFDIWPIYAAAIILGSLMISALVVPLAVWDVRARVRALSLAVQYYPRTGFPELDRDLALGAAYQGVPLVARVVRQVVQLSVAVVVLVTVIGFTRLDAGNGGGPRYVDHGTALWLALRDDGGGMPLGRTDLAQSAYTAFDTQGVWAGVGHLVIPLALVVPYTMALVRSRVAGRRTRAAGAIAISLFAPGAFLLYLITALAVSVGVARLAGRIGPGGIFVGRAT